MNIDELKLVLDTVSTISGDAQAVAIVYLGFNYVVQPVMIIAGIYITINAIKKLVCDTTSDIKEQTFRYVRGVYVLGTGGYCDSVEQEKVREKIRELVKADLKSTEGK